MLPPVAMDICATDMIAPPGIAKEHSNFKMAAQWQQQQFDRPLPPRWEARYDTSKGR